MKNSFFAFLFILSACLYSDNFSFKADKLFSVIAKNKERTVLSGNAYLTSDSTKINAGSIEIFGKDYRYAMCSKKVKVEDDEKQIYLTCSKIFFDRDKDILRAENFVEMEDRKNEVVIKGGFLENFGKENYVIIQIGVRILKKDLVCRSEFARFNRDTEILELSGMPLVIWKGDEYKASKIIIDLKKDEISLEGDVKAKIKTEDEEEKTSGEETSGNVDSPKEENPIQQKNENAEKTPEGNIESTEKNTIPKE